MLNSLKHNVARCALFNALRQDDDGIASIEFAFIAPIMLLMYFGLAEVASAISVDRRISHGASVGGDMVTQAPESSQEDVSEILSAAIRVMSVPRKVITDETTGKPKVVSTGNRIRIDMQSFIRNETTGDVESRGRVLLNYGGTVPTEFDADSLDPRLLSENSGVVVTRVSYAYSPLTTSPKTLQRGGWDKEEGANEDYDTKRFKGVINMNETFLLKPRRSELVDIAPITTPLGVKVTDTLTMCTATTYRDVDCPTTIVD